MDASIDFERIPAVEEAEALLDEGSRMNPGPWVEHSRVTALAARLIAREHPDLDELVAYVVGLLHDIGRREGVHDLRHVTDGYHYLASRGWHAAARICLTHSFPIPELACYSGVNDCKPQDYRLLTGFLSGCQLSLYDKLIQICDHLALPSGFCLLEKRMVDVALRYGNNGHSVAKWKAIFAIRDELQAAMGRSIYSVLPGVIAGTFGTASVS